MITEALRSLRPTASFSVVGEEYSGITWLSQDQNIPSMAEVEAEIERLKVVRELTAYREKRRFEYPPVSDYIDAVYHQANGDDTKMTAYFAAVDAIKQKYPKPEGV